MTKSLKLGSLLVIACACGAARAAAQDLVITNARIIVGNGMVINQGAIVVRGGRIAAVSAGQAPPAGQNPGGQTIDARGATAMAGFIDAHRHVNTGAGEKEQMQQPPPFLLSRRRPQGYYLRDPRTRHLAADHFRSAAGSRRTTTPIRRCSASPRSVSGSSANRR